MVETAETATDEPGADPVPRATLDELVAEPERVASAADVAPVRIERPGGAPLVLVSAATFERLTDPGRTRSMRADELTDRDLDLLRTAPLPPASPEFADDEDLVWRGRRPSWIIVTEVNRFTWPGYGYDLRSTPDGRDSHGAMSPQAVATVRAALVGNARRGVLARTDRDG